MLEALPCSCQIWNVLSPFKQSMWSLVFAVKYYAMDRLTYLLPSVQPVKRDERASNAAHYSKHRYHALSRQSFTFPRAGMFKEHEMDGNIRWV